nr:biotin--[acetyl-CoA-carboxylase] ligase [Bacteroidota bacterium]
MMNNTIGKKILAFETVESTNTLAEKLVLSETPQEGTIILTQFQGHGHGLGANTWESKKGKNLLLSIILYPIFLLPEDQFIINQFVSLSILNCVKQLFPSDAFKIKWPNDIYFKNKKLAGILTKNTISGNHLNSCIIGIGLNVNQESFSPELPNPVSLHQICGGQLDLQVVLEVLISQLNRYYHKLQTDDCVGIRKAYIESLLNFNIRSKYLVNENPVEGTICGISQFGKLQVDIGGSICEFDMKEIVHIFD